jgi:mRNA interferase MazF
MEVDRFDVFLVALDPTVGHEIKKTRPCAVISPDEMEMNGVGVRLKKNTAPA